MSDSATPWAIQSMEFSRPEYWNGQLFLSPGYLPNAGFQPRYPILQVDSLPAEPQGKPKNTEVGRLSLLQQIFPTQELDQGLLHCRQILYQLSYVWYIVIHLIYLKSLMNLIQVWEIALLISLQNSSLHENVELQ